MLELRRMRMPHLYDYFWTKPPSLVPRGAALRGRGADGGRRRRCCTLLDDEEARARSRRASREAEVEAVAVCLLHAHLHPEHERRLGEILRDELPGVPVSLSSEILREQQEYERTATTVVNAYVRPLMSRYVGDLRRGLDAAGVGAADDHAVVRRRDDRRGRGAAARLRARVGPCGRASSRRSRSRERSATRT